MKCKKYEEKMVLYLYGELEEKEKVELEAHLEACPECLKEMASTRKTFKALSEARERIPEADWEKCWKRIDASISEKPQKKMKLFTLPQWVYAAAGVLVIFIVGIVIGRYWVASGKKGVLEPVAAKASSYQPVLNEFIEDLKPMLIEYANYSALGKEETVVMDRDIARNLLIQNLFLRKIIAEKDPSALQFLEDVDLVLKEIANLEKEDTQTPSLIKGLIEQREIIFKMEILQKL